MIAVTYRITCDACRRTTTVPTDSPLNARTDTEAEGWQWVVTDGRMEHVCPACGRGVQ